MLTAAGSMHAGVPKRKRRNVGERRKLPLVFHRIIVVAFRPLRGREGGKQ